MSVLICDHEHCIKDIKLCCHVCDEREGCKGCGLPEICSSQKVYDSMKDYEERSKLMCYHCEEELEEADLTKAPDGERYCEVCFGEHFTTCDSCGELIANDNVWCAEDDDASYCESCYYDAYGTCNDCENEVLNDYLHRTSGDRYVCENCGGEYTSCNDCGVYIEEGDIHLTKEGVPYCQECAREQLTRCEKCQSWIHNDDIVDREGHFYCVECSKVIDEEEVSREMRSREA